MKKLSLAILLAAAGALTSPVVSAAEGTFCNSPTMTGTPSSDKVVYTCGNGVKGTLPELYKMGWRVVAYHEYQNSDSGSARGYGTLVLQKD